MGNDSFTFYARTLRLTALNNPFAWDLDPGDHRIMDLIEQHRYRRLILLYNLLLTTGVAILWPLLLPMVALTEKRRRTVLPRLGLTDRPPAHSTLEPRPLWVHALSVGEVLSAVALVNRLQSELEPRPLFFSAATHTGFQIAARHLGQYARAVFYYPYDFLPCVRAAIERVNPALFVLVESDIWPNFLTELSRRRIPAVLSNARLSKRSLAGYRKISSLSVPLFSSFAAICTQSPQDAKRFSALGIPAEKIFPTGNLKSDQSPARTVSGVMSRIENFIRLRSPKHTLVAGSVHRAEASLLADAFGELKSNGGDIFYVVVPRNPRKSTLFRRRFEQSGLTCCTSNDILKKAGDFKVDVLVVDRMGVLQALYALATVAFVGGSLAPLGGHNPLEPAAWAKPIIFGPHMSDFGHIADKLKTAGGAMEVGDHHGLYKAAAALLEDPAKATAAGQAAREVFETSGGAVAKTIEIIRGLLP